jgi:AcrR family transcriptional regulator
MAERGRPRSFDRQAALQRAMEVFWAKGFEDASMTDLTGAMGIASPSLYAAFGSKDALFQEAVALYQASIGQNIWGSLETEPTIHGAIEAFLMATAAAYSQSDAPAGCLIVLGTRPSGHGNGVVYDELRSRRSDNSLRIRRRFERAVTEGELPNHFDCKAAAAFYATLQQGMSILARDGADAATLEAVARTGAHALASMT